MKGSRCLRSRSIGFCELFAAIGVPGRAAGAPRIIAQEGRFILLYRKITQGHPPGQPCVRRFHVGSTVILCIPEKHLLSVREGASEAAQEVGHATLFLSNGELRAHRNPTLTPKGHEKATNCGQLITLAVLNTLFLRYTLNHINLIPPRGSAYAVNPEHLTTSSLPSRLPHYPYRSHRRAKRIKKSSAFSEHRDSMGMLRSGEDGQETLALATYNRMACVKKSRSEVPAFGEEIARLRTQREWSRSMMIKKLDRVLADAGDTTVKDYSEAWLGRLESGEIVKVSRHIVIILADTLQCSPRERARLLLLADKNVLLDANTTNTAVVEVFNYQMMAISEKVFGFLSSLVASHRIASLSDDELREIFLTALEMVVKHYRASERPD